MDLEIKKKEICLQFEKKVAEKHGINVGELFFNQYHIGLSKKTYINVWLGFGLCEEEDGDYYLMFRFLDLKTCKVYLDEVYISRKFIIFENLYSEEKTKSVIGNGLELVCSFMSKKNWQIRK